MTTVSPEPAPTFDLIAHVRERAAEQARFRAEANATWEREEAERRDRHTAEMVVRYFPTLDVTAVAGAITQGVATIDGLRFRGEVTYGQGHGRSHRLWLLLECAECGAEMREELLEGADLLPYVDDDGRPLPGNPSHCFACVRRAEEAREEERSLPSVPTPRSAEEELVLQLRILIGQMIREADRE
jgi:hypothetical protein